MNTTFWAGIGIGAVLSLFASIAANLFHSRITGYLEKRKFLSHTKRKGRALRIHRIIVDIHDGKRDKYLYMLRQSTGIIVIAVMIFSALGSALVLLALLPTFPKPDEPFLPHVPVFVSLLLLGVLMGFAAMLLSYVTNDLRAVETALDDYPRYLADFEQRWGEPQQ